MDPQCKGTSLFIDLVLQVEKREKQEEKEDHDYHRRITSEDNWGIRSSAIWFCEEFPMYLQLMWVFLMYAVSSFGEELCNVVPLCKINMI